jgi:ArsR family transcriptional regulator, lead/cadmium/zinc/bismuth-responsive transcriptional repressor
MKNPLAHDHRQSIQSALKTIQDTETVFHISETFKLLGDPTRLKIVMALTKEELCVFDLAQVLSISDSAVSHQLRILRTLRLVKQRKEGKLVFYTLDDEHIEDLIRVATRHYTE